MTSTPKRHSRNTRAPRSSHRLLVLVAVGMVALPSLLPAQLRILFIGNSFTQGSADAADRAAVSGGVPGIFDRLAQAGGQVNPTTVMRAVGGTDFQFHAGDTASRNAIASQPWDYVVLQNYSIEPTHLVDGSHSLADHYTYGTQLYQLVLASNPLTRVLLYETWSRAAAHPLITGISSPNSFASTAEFQTELRTNYLGLADYLNANFPTNPAVAVAPVGDAWENAGGLLAASDPQFVDLFANDNYHGNDNGYYLAAAVFYATIYGASPQGLSTNSLVSGLNLNLTVPAAFLEDIAWAAVTGSNQSGSVVLIQQPVSQTVAEFQPVTFTATALGTAPLFVTWFSNSVPIPGATQFSYTIPSVTSNMSGSYFSVTVTNANSSVTSSNALLTVTPAPPATTQAQTFLFDFGGPNTVGFGPSPDDPLHYWNNVTTAIGSTSSGRLPNLVTSRNMATGFGLVMLSRFNGANENGTLAFAGLPQDATRDSLFGNTESFGGLASIFPSFKITGLHPLAYYNFTFYASRTGVADNRETGYTVLGGNSGFAALNVANNISGFMPVNNIQPTSAGEIAISIAPTTNNNNANHFTYLGVMKIIVVPSFISYAVADGQLTLRWIGDGQLEWASSSLGPWLPITPVPASPYTESALTNHIRFFRLNASL